MSEDKGIQLPRKCCQQLAQFIQKRSPSYQEKRKILKKAKQKAFAFTVYYICVVIRYIGYILVLIAEGSQLSSPYNQSSSPSEAYIINVFNVAGCPQLLSWFVIISGVFLPKFKSLHKKALHDEQLGQKKKLQEQIWTQARFQAEIGNQQQALQLLKNTPIGKRYKAIFYDQIVDVLSFIKIVLIFTATILITINNKTYDNILTNIGLGVALISLIVQKYLKIKQFYWQIQEEFESEVMKRLNKWKRFEQKKQKGGN